MSIPGKLRALSPTDGSTHWRISTARAFEGPAFGSRGNRVFVGHDGVVRALRLDDGAEIWRRTFDFTLSGVSTPRAGTSSTVFVGDYAGRLRALSPLDGTTRWTVTVEDGQFSPSVQRTHDRLIVGGTAGVHALDPVSGEQQWSQTPDAEGHFDISASTTVFANTRHRLWALDPETGTERWQYNPEERLVGPAAAGDQAVVGVGDTVYALDGAPRSNGS